MIGVGGAPEVQLAVSIVHALPDESLGRLERAPVARLHSLNFSVLAILRQRLNVYLQGCSLLYGRGGHRHLTYLAHALSDLINAAPIAKFVLPVRVLDDVCLEYLNARTHHNTLHVYLALGIDEIGRVVEHYGAVPGFR